jgi:hypothetical protein
LTDIPLRDFLSAAGATAPPVDLALREHPLDALASPFRNFKRDEWAKLRADTELTLTIDDLRKVQSTHDPISLDEVEAIYLPLSRSMSRRRRGCSKRRSAFSAPTTARCPISSASPARWPSANRRRRACCRRC